MCNCTSSWKFLGKHKFYTWLLYKGEGQREVVTDSWNVSTYTQDWHWLWRSLKARPTLFLHIPLITSSPPVWYSYSLAITHWILEHMILFGMVLPKLGKLTQLANIWGSYMWDMCCRLQPHGLNETNPLWGQAASKPYLPLSEMSTLQLHWQKWRWHIEDE
jgi:hypothetical protein